LTFLTIASLAITILGADWTRMPGSAIQISAKGNELWAVTPSFALIWWDGSGWQTTPYNPGARLVAAGSDRPWVLPQGSMVPFRYNDWSHPFTASSDNYLLHLNCFNSTNCVFVRTDGTILRYVAGVTPPPTLPNANNVMYAAIGDNNEVWILDYSGRIFR